MTFPLRLNWQMGLWLLIPSPFLLRPCAAQVLVATVTHNANLRKDPSTNQSPIRMLTPPEELKVLSATKVNGYYNVSTDQNEQGWVYSTLVSVDEVQQVAQVTHNANLRRDPSTNQSPIRLLTPPEQLQVLDMTPVNRYYHVSTTAHEEGWVYGPYIDITAASAPTPTPGASPFPDAHDAPTAGWTGPVFKLSQDYPTSAPAPETKPWKQIDFKTQPEAYLRSVLQYAMDGNLAVDWQGDRNTVRKWYHVPWLHVTENGREFVHGLTRERSSRPGELHPQQSTTFANYAVGLYNPAGGYVIGQVWRDHDNPDPSAAHFPDGTVAVKLLFTTATVAQVPYLKNDFDWDADVSTSGSSAGRTIKKVRLLQIDLAIRDSRAGSTTGWVFGTFAYDGDAAGATPWDRMRPIGLMWGNDPTLTPTAFQNGQRATQSIIINPVVGTTQHLGWLQRLNGPVDNPRSACTSCHGAAQYEMLSGVLPSATMTDAQKMRWFRNIPDGTPFDAGQESLGYSLQLAVSIKNFFDNRQAPVR